MKDKNRNKLLLTTQYEDTRLSYAPADQTIDEELEDTNEIFKIKSTLALKNLIHDNYDDSLPKDTLDEHSMTDLLFI